MDHPWNHTCEIKAMLCASPLYCRKRDADGNCKKIRMPGKKDLRPDCFSCVAVRISLSKDENNDIKISTSIEADQTNEVLNTNIDRVLSSLFSRGGT